MHKNRIFIIPSPTSRNREETHRSVDSCTSSAAWKKTSFCHCSNPPGAAIFDGHGHRSNQGGASSRLPTVKNNSGGSKLQPRRPNPARRTEHRDLARAEGADHELCTPRKRGDGEIASSLSWAGALRRGDEEGGVRWWATAGGGRGGAGGGERQVNYSPATFFAFLLRPDGAGYVLVLGSLLLFFSFFPLLLFFPPVSLGQWSGAVSCYRSHGNCAVTVKNTVNQSVLQYCYSIRVLFA
jgi:hypothetical protein